MTVSIGKPVPRLRLTAVVKGEYMHLERSVTAERWIALCFPASLRAEDLLCLNRQAECFAREGATLLGVVSDRMLLQSLCHRELRDMTTPLLTDPLNRLHRAYGMSQESAKTNTFLIDPGRVLRHHIVHELTTWNMEMLRGLLALTPIESPDADTIFMKRSQECRT